MFNTLTRNLKILNKDNFESSWIKCLVDDAPKTKHLANLQKCLNGQDIHITAKEALSKLTKFVNYKQKPIALLKSLFILHYLKLGALNKQQDMDPQQKITDQVLTVITQNYGQYLRDRRDAYEQMSLIYKMTRQLEIVLIKLELPIIKAITTRLLFDMIYWYQSIPHPNFTQEENQKYIKAAKQLKRFLKLRSFLILNDEHMRVINSIQFPEQQHSVPPKIVLHQSIIESTNIIKFDQMDDQQQEQDVAQVIDCFQSTDRPQNFDQTRAISTQRNGGRTLKFPTTQFRTSSITQRTQFFDQNQSPLSFITYD